MALSRLTDTKFRAPVALLAASALMAGCATVKLEAPDKPIEINLNVNITQELLIKVDKDVEDLISSNPDIF
ncbi:YnbE family lipoprotein [Parvularcula sp. IMCC14364]|uniref:YnbE family lipoprotein n=1 Tax=Parvularcula sp. IMCC14364 TaxID=3067902 RepID=UPI002741002F|nr:YnbE family lipoprotein [Parvularcula sp. IMCC14364]